jgi:hypothetical protein
MGEDRPEPSTLELGSVSFRTGLRRTWTGPAESGTAMTLTAVARGGCPGMGWGMRAAGKAHLTSLET